MTFVINGTSGATQSASFDSASTFGFKNRIINGAMMIDQRNAGASVTPANGAYTLDRYIVIAYQASKFTVQQNAGAVTPPIGFVNYLGVTSSSAYTVGAGEYFMVGQRIEGNNLSDMAWGTANAATSTLSFRVYSSLTGTFGGALINGAANRSYPFSFTVSSANTWTTISITIAGDTSGTWAATTGTGAQVCFNLGAGSTFSGTANTWQAGQIQAPTGSVSVVGTSGATFYITGVQLEKGSTATSFDYRPYGTELALCQRYFVQDTYYTLLPAGSITLRRDKSYFPVAMRTTSPTVTFNDQAGNTGKVYRNAANQSASIFSTTDKGFAINITTGGAVTGDDLAFNWFSTAEL